jgi:hypothetical protein
LKIPEPRGCQIQVQEGVAAFTVQIYRKDSLLFTVLNPDDPGGRFRTSAAAIHASKEWIDQTYPKGRIKYFE